MYIPPTAAAYLPYLVFHSIYPIPSHPCRHLLAQAKPTNPLLPPLSSPYFPPLSSPSFPLVFESSSPFSLPLLFPHFSQFFSVFHNVMGRV